MALRAGLRLRGHKRRHDVAVGMVASLGCLRQKRRQRWKSLCKLWGLQPGVCVCQLGQEVCFWLATGAALHGELPCSKETHSDPLSFCAHFCKCLFSFLLFFCRQHCSHSSEAIIEAGMQCLFTMKVTCHSGFQLSSSLPANPIVHTEE